MSGRDDSPPRFAPPRNPVIAFLWFLLGVLLLALLIPSLLADGGASVARVRPLVTPPTLDSRGADAVARRIAAVHADVTAVWRHDFRWRLGRAYAPPEVVRFTGRRPSPCVGAQGVSGVAYCAIDRTLSLDLAFLGEVALRLAGEGERALALLIARGTAPHVQAELAILGDADRLRRDLGPEARRLLELDLALQADCFTGVWARRAARQLGPLARGAWARIVADVREASPDAAGAARLDLGDPAAREEAFARGYADGRLHDCLAPGLAGVLG